MEKGTEKYIDTIRYLGKMYDYLNEKLFNGELIKPVITVQLSAGNKAYGWWTPKRVWREDKIDKGEYELNISAQFLNRSIKETASTLIHEMCHQYASAHGIKDVSRGGVYHNKFYKKVAEDHALLVGFVKTIGWSVTKLTEKSEQLIDEYLQHNPANVIYRLPDAEKIRGKASSSTRKYVCTICGASVRATKSVNIICADCSEKMVEEIK